jgi:TonB family protein
MCVPGIDRGSRSRRRARVTVRRLMIAATGFICLAVAVVPSKAQGDCSQLGIEHSGTLTYPVAGRAARIAGDVVLLATFSPDGSVLSVDVKSGPALRDIRRAALNYVSSWQVNRAARNASCSITVSFRFSEGEPNCEYRPSTVTMSSTQHFIVTAPRVWTCDPATTITRRRYSFLFVHWHSKPVVHIDE